MSVTEILQRPPRPQTAESLAGSLWNDLFTAPIKKAVTSLFESSVIYCGSSGAVCALLGCNFAVALKRVASVLCNNFLGDNKVVLKNGVIVKKFSQSHIKSVFLLLAKDLPFLLSAGTMVFHEWQSLQSSDESGSWFRTFYSSKTIINHAAHLQGFAFGAVVSFAALNIKS